MTRKYVALRLLPAVLPFLFACGPSDPMTLCGRLQHEGLAHNCRPIDPTDAWVAGRDAGHVKAAVRFDDPTGHVGEESVGEVLAYDAVSYEFIRGFREELPKDPEHADSIMVFSSRYTWNDQIRVVVAVRGGFDRQAAGRVADATREWSR